MKFDLSRPVITSDLGRPFDVIESLHIVIMRCTCHPSNRAMTIVGPGDTKMCGRCQRRFMLAMIQYDARKQEDTDPNEAIKGQKVGVGLAVAEPTILASHRGGLVP
jgi:hypothetical protein